MFSFKAMGLAVIGLGLPAGCTVPLVLTRADAAAYEASLSPAGAGFVAAWHDSGEIVSTLRAVRVDAKGQRLGAEMKLTDGQQSAWEADIETLGDGFVVAWYETPRYGTDQAWVGRFSATGERSWGRRLGHGDRNCRNPVVLADQEALFVAWIERHASGADIWAQGIGPSGEDLGAPVFVAPAGFTTWNLNADRDGDSVWLAFDADSDSKADEVFLARLRMHDATPVVETLQRLTDDDGYASKYPDVATGAGTLALAWFDDRDGNREIYLHTSGNEDPGSGSTRRVTTSEGDSIGAYLSWNGDAFGLAWSDADRDSYDIYFRSLTADGRTLGEVQRLTHNPTASLIPAIEPTSRGFALAWNEDVVEQRSSHLVGGRSDVVFTTVSVP